MVVFNTFRHTKENPRFRVFIPTTGVMPPEAYTKIWDQIALKIRDAGLSVGKPKKGESKRSGRDKSKRSPTSLFYLPCQAQNPEESFFKEYKVERTALHPADWIENSAFDFEASDFRSFDFQQEDRATTSQLSGRTNEELAATGEIRKDHAAQARAAKARKAFLPNISKLSGARAGLLPAFLEPSLTSPCEGPPSGPKWIHEIKCDGYRMQARIDGRKICLLTRKKLDWTERFLSIADALKALGLGSATEKGVRWVEPRLVCEIEYRGGTGDRLLRAAAFKGLRDDKSAEEIVLEAPP